MTPTQQDAEAVARQALDRCYEGAAERGGYDVSAYCEARDAFREAVERRVREQVAADVESLESIASLAHVVDDVNPRQTHHGDQDDAEVYCRYIAKRIRAATQDHHTGGDDGQ